MNVHVAPWESIYVRRAVAYALDRANLVKALGIPGQAVTTAIPPDQAVDDQWATQRAVVNVDVLLRRAFSRTLLFGQNNRAPIERRSVGIASTGCRGERRPTFILG
jgi:hypothetical protein